MNYWRAFLLSLLVLTAVETHGAAKARPNALLKAFNAYKKTPSEQHFQEIRSALAKGESSLIETQEIFKRKALKEAHIFRSNLLAHPHDPKLIEYDIAILGDGVHAMEAAAIIRRSHPELKVILITSATELGGAFQKTGGFYRLNSAETPEQSTHHLAKAPIQLLDIAKPGYIVSKHLGEVIALNDLLSGNVLIENRVDDIQKSADPKFRYDLSLSTGVQLKAKAVIAAPGLDLKRFYGYLDPESMQLIERVSTSAPYAVPHIEHYRELAARGTKLAAQGKSFLSPYVGAHVAVIGDGGAGATVIEALASMGPGTLYGKKEDGLLGEKHGPGIGEPGGVASLDWWGQSHLTATEFKQNTTERLHSTILPIYDSIIKHADRVSKIEEGKLADGSTKYRVYDRDGNYLEYDYVIFATGYDQSIIPPYLQHYMFESFNLKDVHGNIPGHPQTLIARTPEKTQDPHFIVVGPAAGVLADGTEAAASPTRTQTSVHVLNARTAAAAQKIADTVARENQEN